MVEQHNLRDNLILFNYMVDYLGARNMHQLQETLKNMNEAYDDDGYSYFVGALKGLKPTIGNELKKYDYNIKSYLESINRTRTKTIQLKYFQYIAVLFTEIFLDKLIKDSDDFIRKLNEFANKHNANHQTPLFSKNSLRKLAFWMATGSGKTLIMHINWLQFCKYNNKPIDNMLLITPNENLSNQHLEEFQNSGIPAQIFSECEQEKDVIKIIEIHKLTRETKGEGVSVNIESFDGNNLIFVDEGHRGFTGNRWKSIRDEISMIGFTFEYSATFNEAIRNNNDELMNEYSRAIIMDYSYSYFYNDGFGKEFTILNLQDDINSEYVDRIFLINLLSYYQQLKFYTEKNKELQEFAFEKPLWIFVGNSVSSSNRDKFHEDTLSDIQNLVKFLMDFLGSPEKYKNCIEAIMCDENERRLFPQDLKFIREFNLTPTQLYEDILKLVFHSESSGDLKLCTISNAPGEICLKIATCENYFALIYIGDVSNFMRGFDDKHKSTDRFARNHFSSINNPDSKINILIGSKKFIEGWNSFRVSTMGLLNMGNSQGSQIIQLFGRGVRLKGYKNLMKRSKTLITENKLDNHSVDNEIKYLETLNIFGIHADYVQQFREQLEAEEIGEKELITLPICKNNKFLRSNLVEVRSKSDDKFSEIVELEPDNQIHEISIDITPNLQSYASSEEDQNIETRNKFEITTNNLLDIMDWEKIYFKLYEFKQQKMFYNLSFNHHVLRKIIQHNYHRVRSSMEYKIDSIERLRHIEDICVIILQKYVTVFYNRRKKEWITDNMEYGILDKNNGNFQNYEIVIDSNDQDRITEINRIIDLGDRMYSEDKDELASIVFDRHLYQPLMVQNNQFVTIPTGLNEGERNFIEDLRTYFSDKQDKLTGKQFFILRNLSRRGIGFFAETDNFYPDFILWAKDGERQKITFIDPKGLIHSPAEQIRKINMYKTLKCITENLGRDDVELTSFVISTSKLEKVVGLDGAYTWEGFLDKHVVFPFDTPDYIDTLIQRAMPTTRWP